ncbi:MAG: hypothetical protein RLZZ493_810 [Bacteroidota bacterium]|jgi:hypothetical protein
MTTINRFLKAQLPTIIGSVVGIIAGYMYYLQVGCSTGACAISASPTKSMLLFALMGGILGSMFQPKKR